MKRRPPKKGSVRKTTHKQNTLLVDGNALYKRGVTGAKNEYNSKGAHIGGIYQFLTVLRKLMEQDLYHKVFVFWDGEFSGKLRWEFYKDYKSSRGKDFINGTKPEDFEEILQRRVVFNYLEELYVRQLIDEKVESDDFIAYYCNVMKDVENITIVTSDRDLCQLIDDNVKMYILDKKKYINKHNFKEEFGYHYENVAVIKILAGDASDDIKGVKGVGDKTLIKLFPQLTERKVTLNEILDLTNELRQARIDGKKKPLKSLENIANGVTDGIQGEKLYEINTRLVDLTMPLLTEEAVEELDILMESPLSDDRSIKNAYRMLNEHGIDKMLGQTRYNEYFLPFKKLMEREKKNNLIK